mmetsp:Transcript_17445/g.32231  ORF Transcript_17445/g.32231 Transcript_17445/m.32231 type:complete len:84 (-) Transcript_17445:328-579(-)
MQQDVTKCTFCLAVLSGSTLRRTPVSIGSTLELKTSQNEYHQAKQIFFESKILFFYYHYSIITRCFPQGSARNYLKIKEAQCT